VCEGPDRLGWAGALLVRRAGVYVFLVLIVASVLGQFSEALGGTLQTQSAVSITAGWATAFLSGTLAFFHAPHRAASTAGSASQLSRSGPLAVALAAFWLAARSRS
jgi:hypothetical protein